MATNVTAARFRGTILPGKEAVVRVLRVLIVHSTYERILFRMRAGLRTLGLLFRRARGLAGPLLAADAVSPFLHARHFRFVRQEAYVSGNSMFTLLFVWHAERKH